jgi:transposase
LYGLNERTFQRYYREHFSGYDESTFDETLVFEENLGPSMSIDDTMLLKGEYSTVLGNKKTGKLMGLITGTKAEDVVDALRPVPLAKRLEVKEISMDMASSYDWATRELFPNAIKVIDRFHVAQLVNDAVQEVRIRYRREALEADNRLRKEARQLKEKYYPARYENGDTKKELLARGRYLLFKAKDDWVESQAQRAVILFREYPEIERVYFASQKLRSIYEKKIGRKAARKQLSAWYEYVMSLDINEMISAKETVENHEGRILNFFTSRETNAFAESLNAKLKRFRAMNYGVTDKKFFLFRVAGYFS